MFITLTVSDFLATPYYVKSSLVWGVVVFSTDWTWTMWFKLALCLGVTVSCCGCSKPKPPPVVKRVRERPPIIVDQPTRTEKSVAVAKKAEEPVQIKGPEKVVSTVAVNTALEPLDLTSRYQRPASDFDGIRGVPWRDVPRNRQLFGNIPLEIGGLICLWGEENAKRGLKFPEEVKGIPVARKFDSLYLYHAGFYCSGDGSAVAKLALQYADGSSAVIELVDGTHLLDWFGGLETPVLKDPDSKMVWRGVNSMSTKTPPGQIRFFITEIPNMRPLDEVSTIDLMSAKGKAASVILAMTTGPAKQLKVEPEKTETTAKEPAKDDAKPEKKGEK